MPSLPASQNNETYGTYFEQCTMLQSIHYRLHGNSFYVKHKLCYIQAIQSTKAVFATPGPRPHINISKLANLKHVHIRTVRHN